MTTVRILVRHDGSGWRIASPGRDLDSASGPRPYTQRDDDLRCPVCGPHAAGAGENASVYVENSDGLRLVAEEDLQVWRKH